MKELRGSRAWWRRRRHGVATPFRLDPFDPGPFREGRGDDVVFVVVVHLVPHPTKQEADRAPQRKRKAGRAATHPAPDEAAAAGSISGRSMAAPEEAAADAFCVWSAPEDAIVGGRSSSCSSMPSGRTYRLPHSRSAAVCSLWSVWGRDSRVREANLSSVWRKGSPVRVVRFVREREREREAGCKIE